MKVTDKHRYMKQILKYIAAAFLAASALAGCQERYVTYSDAEYVMFADTMATYPVQKDVEYFSIDSCQGL